MLDFSLAWCKQLQQYRAIAVIRCSAVDLGLEMAKAVAAGGMRLIEITWNSQYPTEIIARLREELPHCTIGVGTILTAAQLREAIAAGTQFCFTPHVNEKLIQMALEANLPLVAGALSPTEIVTAWQAGAACVKVFPVQAVGGVSYIKCLQGPLGQIPLIPTGGVTLENAVDFITAGAIAVGLAGELFPASAVAARDWQAITQQAQLLQQRLSQSFLNPILT